VLRRVLPGLALGFCLVAGPGGVGADPLLRTNPQHLAPPPEGDSATDHPPVVRWPSPPQVVVRAKTGWRQGGTLDKAATAACRAGRFGERTSMLYRAVFDDDVLGVAFGYGLNLYDPDHKADAKTIYLFRFGGLTSCQVLTMPNPDPRVSGAAR